MIPLSYSFTQSSTTKSFEVYTSYIFIHLTIVYLQLTVVWDYLVVRYGTDVTPDFFKKYSLPSLLLKVLEIIILNSNGLEVFRSV